MSGVQDTFSYLLLYLFGEDNGTPLQYSCLANLMDGGAWWAAVHGVARSQTWLSNFPFTFHFSLSCVGEGNGNPLQCSRLENPRDREAWWAAVYEVAQSRTRLKRLNSSSSSSSIYISVCTYICFYKHPHMQSNKTWNRKEKSKVPTKGSGWNLLPHVSIPSFV